MTVVMWENVGHIHPGWYIGGFGKFNTIYCKVQLKTDYNGGKSCNNIGYVIKKVRMALYHQVLSLESKWLL